MDILNKKWMPKVILALILGIGLLIFLFPLFWLLSTSFKIQNNMILIPPQWFPWPITLEHYANAIYKEMPFINLLKNSVIVAGGTGFVSITLGSLAAYGLTRYLRASSNNIIQLILAGQMFPGVMLVIPFYVFLRQIDQLDSYFGLILANTSLALPFTTYMMKGFFDSIPPDLEEAAQIDGCNRIQAFNKIIVPLAIPGVVSTFFMAIVIAWDEYIFALTLITSNSMRTLPIGIVGSFVGEFSVKWGEMMAAAVMMSIPLVVIFLFLQRYLVQGLTAGAVKG